jgi:hypothetical protein
MPIEVLLQLIFSTPKVLSRFYFKAIICTIYIFSVISMLFHNDNMPSYNLCHILMLIYNLKSLFQNFLNFISCILIFKFIAALLQCNFALVVGFLDFACIPYVYFLYASFIKYNLLGFYLSL